MAADRAPDPSSSSATGRRSRRAIWRPFADALSTDHTVYVWDMPGYGASSKAAEHAVDLGVQGELLADLIAEGGLVRPQ